MSSPTPDAADGQRGRGLCQHVAAGSFRHARADGRVNRSRRHGIDPDRRQFQRQTLGQRFKCAVDRADDRGAGPGTGAEVTGHKRQRAAGTDLGRTRDTPGTPKLAFHGRANIVHGNGLERPRAQLRSRDNDMVDRPAFAEKIRDAFVAGDIGDECLSHRFYLRRPSSARHCGTRPRRRRLPALQVLRSQDRCRTNLRRRQLSSRQATSCWFPSLEMRASSDN